LITRHQAGGFISSRLRMPVPKGLPRNPWGRWRNPPATCVRIRLLPPSPSPMIRPPSSN